MVSERDNTTGQASLQEKARLTERHFPTPALRCFCAHAWYSYGIIAHENDAERATRCAMGIASDLKERGVTSSAGVTTGEVYCGLVGGDTRCEYALIGDTVNMSARLMSSTTDQIRCDSTTHARSERRILFETLEPIWVKGKSEAVPVFKPLAGSVSAALSLRRIPIIGRDEEIDLITRRIGLFDNLRGSATIFLRGEAGMGKTKLLAETLTIINQHQIRVGPRKGCYESMPHDGNLSLLVAVLSEQWSLLDSMSPEARASVVRTEVSKLASPFHTAQIGLLSLVFPRVALRKSSVRSMPTGSHFTILVKMVVDLMLGDIRREKKCILCDNAHNLDLQSWSCLQNVFRALQRNLLLVLSCRPLKSAETMRILKCTCGEKQTRANCDRERTRTNRVTSRTCSSLLVSNRVHQLREQPGA